MLNLKRYYNNVMQILKMAPNPIDDQIVIFPIFIIIIFKKSKNYLYYITKTFVG